MSTNERTGLHDRWERSEVRRRWFHSRHSRRCWGVGSSQGCEVASADCWANQTLTLLWHSAGPVPAEALEVRKTSGLGVDLEVGLGPYPLRSPLLPSEG